MLESALRAAVGDAHVLCDDDARAGYETDWTGRFSGRARAVVRPADTAEVVAVVRACAEHGTAIVPQGGNTGMVGAGVPRGGEVVVSLTRLGALGEIDRGSLQVDVGAGVTLAALQAHARRAGLDAAVDFGARDSATAGGLVATDAGGMRALRHGTVRARVAGLEAVLADGGVIDRTAGLLKDNAGYDLAALLVGSEGTLALITRVRWRLVPLLPARVAAIVPLASLGEAAGLLAELRPRLPSLEAADFFLDDGLDLVLDHLGVDAPVPRAPAYVVLECAAADDPTAELAAALGDTDAVVADSTAERERLWRLREAHTEAIAARRRPAQARRRRAAGAARRVRGRRACRGGGGRAGRPRDPLRPPRRRQRARQRARDGRRPRRRGGPPGRRGARRDDQRRARRRRRQGGVPRARAERGRAAGDARGEARARPRGPAQPGRGAGLSRSSAARSGAGIGTGRRVARSTNTCTNQPVAALSSAPPRNTASS